MIDDDARPEDDSDRATTGEAFFAEEEPPRLIDPIYALLGLTIAIAGAFVAYLTWGVGPRVVAAPSPAPSAVGVVDQVPAPRPAPIDPSTIPVKTKKGELMKKALTERNERAKAAAAAAPGGTKRVASAGSTDVKVVVAGPGKGAVEKRLRGLSGIAVVDNSAERGFMVSTRVDEGGSGGTVTVRCSAAISEMPAKKLVASLASDAEVRAERTARDELVRDATDACLTSLVDDVQGWVRAHK